MYIPPGSSTARSHRDKIPSLRSIELSKSTAWSPVSNFPSTPPHRMSVFLGHYLIRGHDITRRISLTCSFHPAANFAAFSLRASYPSTARNGHRDVVSSSVWGHGLHLCFLTSSPSLHSRCTRAARHRDRRPFHFSNLWDDPREVSILHSSEVR